MRHKVRLSVGWYSHVMVDEVGWKAGRILRSLGFNSLWDHRGHSAFTGLGDGDEITGQPRQQTFQHPAFQPNSTKIIIQHQRHEAGR